MDYARAKAELALLTVSASGLECICLFALHHIDAVDTHIRQNAGHTYPKGFPLKRYKGLCEGVMQQYAFYYELSLKD